jgi:amino acid adenylation domain-containing protein
MNTDLGSELAALRQRLTGLSDAQRGELARRLAGEPSGSAARGAAPAAIPKARPLSRAVQPVGGGTDRQVALYPATHRQQGMWVLHQYAPQSPVYNYPSAFRLQGPQSVAGLEQAFTRLIERHDTLRTTFAMKDGVLVQRVAADSAFQLQQVNLEEAEVRRVAAEEWIEQAACLPFDLTAEPAIRALLVRLQAEEHVLLVVMHHIISDGWSCSNLWRELSALYEAPATDGAALRELPVQFADYAAWQKDRLERGALAEQTAYWKTKLAGESVPLDLPSDRTRPADVSFRGECCSLPLDPALMTGLKTRAREEGATLFMILLAAFKTLLHRYTGRNDLVVGVLAANRPHVELEGLLGYFVNTLVLRTDCSGTPTFRELLGRVKDTAREAYAHQDLPFEHLVELLQVRRAPGRTPLLQTVFALQDFPEASLHLPGLRATPWPVSTHTAQFELSLTVDRTPEGWSATAEYSTDLFDRDRMERLLGHWHVLLEGIVADPDRRVSELPLLPPAERRLLLETWSGRESTYPTGPCVHELFADEARRRPTAVGVVYEQESLTYAELDRRSNQLAHYLRRHGAGPGTAVGVCLERSPDLVVAVLGVLKAGSAYVPLDPEHAPDRLAFVLANAGALLVLTSSAVCSSLGASGARRICLDQCAEAIGQMPDGDPAIPVSGDDLAYVLYTSGSTGEPKGVMVRHANLLNAYHAWEEAYRLSAWIPTYLQTAHFSFDVWTGDLVRALCSGGKLVLCPHETLLEAEKLHALIVRENVDAMEVVPVVIRNLLRYLDATGKRLDGLRLIVVGADVWHAGDHEHLKRLVGPQTRVLNSYGITETTIDSSYFEGDVSGWPRDAVVPIGKPFPNTRFCILDRNLEPAPIGIPGELHIGGPGLAAGYAGRPDLTAQRFIAHPFSSQPGARLYKTGDLARWLPDGDVEFLGRLDHQVKIRGFRIELGEVETCIRRHPGIDQCAVVAREDEPGDVYLVAYLVASNPHAALSPADLRVFLKQKLPDYMVPSVFVLLERLPLTPSGKLDRKALPPPELTRAQVSREYVAPRTPTEEVIAAVWAEVLRVKEVGVHDSFFELGGHSLLAIQMVARMEHALGAKVPLAALFQLNTVARIAALIEDQKDGPAGEVRDPSASAPPGLDPDIYRQLLAYTAGWKGTRVHPESLLFGLNCTGTRQPLYWCLQGFAELDQLAKHLGEDQPVYGMRSGHLIMEYTRENVEALAGHYVDELVRVNPQGPYLLGGNCQAGTIALSMARQLQSAGKEVMLLTILELAAYLEYYLGAFSAGKVITLLTIEELTELLHQLELNNPVHPAYDGPVSLLFGSESAFNPYRLVQNPELGLRKLFPQLLSIQLIPADHGQFFEEPNIQIMARQLNDSIARAQSLAPAWPGPERPAESAWPAR